MLRNAISYNELVYVQLETHVYSPKAFLRYKSKQILKGYANKYKLLCKARYQLPLPSFLEFTFSSPASQLPCLAEFCLVSYYYSD